MIFKMNQNTVILQFSRLNSHQLQLIENILLIIQYFRVLCQISQIIRHHIKASQQPSIILYIFLARDLRLVRAKLPNTSKFAINLCQFVFIFLLSTLQLIFLQKIDSLHGLDMVVSSTYVHASINKYEQQKMKGSFNLQSPLRQQLIYELDKNYKSRIINERNHHSNKTNSEYYKMKYHKPYSPKYRIIFEFYLIYPPQIHKSHLK
ncbi:hypothetical protein pb186bvf_020398 [Paramecium bursaria]